MRSKKSALTKYFLVLSTLVLILATLGWAADDKDSDDQPDIVKRMNNAANVLSEIMGTPDKAVKIASVFGGNHGKGIATCRTQRGWSPPALIHFVVCITAMLGYVVPQLQ